MGGAALLVETVEEFTGLTIDHYVEVGFDGVAGVVDAVDHVNLCIDQDVDDDRSGLQMTERSEEHTSELQSRGHLVCRLLLEKKTPPSRTSTTHSTPWQMSHRRSSTR